MKSSYRYKLFTSIFVIFLSISWLKELSSSFDPLYPVDPAQTTHTAVVPVTAAQNLPQKDGIPADSGLLSRAARQSQYGQTGAVTGFEHSEGLHGFIEQVAYEEYPGLAGVFVEEVMALPVVQQPEGDSLYVSRSLGNVTQFQSAAGHGVTGLLAHNYLSGDLFFGLELGQEVNLVYGDGQVSRYLVEDIQSYEKLEGDFYTSNYVNLETGEEVTTPELFRRMYTGLDKVTFQTCIKNGSDWSWGRIFIVATPLR
jgi:hypothetical protein